MSGQISSSSTSIKVVVGILLVISAADVEGTGMASSVLHVKSGQLVSQNTVVAEQWLYA